MIRSRRLAKLEDERREAAKRSVIPVFISSDKSEPAPEGTLMRINLSLSPTMKVDLSTLTVEPPTPETMSTSGDKVSATPERPAPERPRGSVASRP
jgi:hypothetical protein